MHPSASSLRVVPPGEVEEPYQLGLQAYETDDFKQAAMWFQQAAEQGHARAQYELAKMYLRGDGIEQSWAQAAFWYSQAAEQGQEIAVNCLRRVSRVIKALNDFEREAGEYREAAEQGDPDAQYKLGRICESFRFPTEEKVGEMRIADLKFEKDYRQKIKNQGVVWYLKAVEQGHVKAQFELASIYEDDDGIEDHIGQAVKWYLKAAEQGHVSAQSTLGYFYRNGIGVEQNVEQAVMWYQKAVDKDDDEARKLLGFMYAEGEGVKQDFYKAAYLQMLGNLQNSDGDQKSVALHDKVRVENGSILDYILDVLRDYPEFKGVTRVKIREFTSTEVSCSAVDRLIRSDSDIQKLWIVFPDPKFNRFKTGDTTAVDATDFVKKFAESIRVTNTRLTHLNFSESFQYAFVDDAALAILNQVLHRNKSIAKLRGYLQQHPAVHSDELPLEVLMPLADQLIVHGCRSGQSRGAVKAALDEFLMSVQAGRLNVPVRQPVQ
jgi:TPR repeat protein